jgi:hypothetical protein
MVFVQLSKSDQEGKKYKAVFYKDENRQKIRTVHFGAVGYQDFTQHKDEDRKQAYLERHKKNEEWSDYMSAGACSRWILWNKPSLSASYNHYIKKFGLKKY